MIAAAPATELNQRVLLLLLVAVGLIIIPHFGHIPTLLSVLFSVFWCWRLLGVWQPRFLPASWVVLVAALGCLFVIYSQHRGVWTKEIGTAVFVMALAVKLLELNKKRDVYLLCYLALMLIGAQFLFQQTIFILIYSLALSCLLFACLLGINTVTPHNKAILLSATKILLQALPIAMLIFILFPRFQPPKWALMNRTGAKAHAGLSDTLEPGSINELAVSRELVFRAKFEGELPPQNQLYWRGPVYSYTDGSVWRISQNDFVSQYQDKLKFSGPAYRYTLLMEPQSRNWVFALEMPSRFDRNLFRNAAYQLINRNSSDEAAEYTLISHPQYNTGYITKTEYWENRQLPGRPSERISDLVKQLHGFENSPELYIQALLDYFRREHFSYTLKPPLMQKEPIETFLFDAKRGFCNHFATAFVYLMRVADIPARVVGGYQGGEYNQVGQFFEVKQANAHAWAEVWLEGKGWVRVDPTSAIAPQRMEQAVDVRQQVETGAVSLTPVQAENTENESNLLLAEAWLNDLDYHWERWIVGYGEKNQESVLASVGIDNWLLKLFWLMGVIALAMSVLGVILLKKRLSSEDRVLKLYRQYCRKMAMAGLEIQIGEGAAAFSERAKLHKPELAGHIDELTQTFIRLRYERVCSARDFSVFKKLIRTL